MARARNIKPGFFRNADLAELPYEARLLFIGLWTIADREGRLEDRPKQIKMEIFPADNVDCEELLKALANTGMLVRYESCGKRLIQVTNFSKHQNPHRDERASTLPGPDETSAITVKAPCEHSASTVQAQCDNSVSTVGIGLIPDSGFLIPESTEAKASVVASKETGDPFPQCPQAEIIEAYKRLLPDLPQPRVWDGNRANNLRARWRWVVGDLKTKGKPHSEAAGIAWFERFFGYVAKSDFLCGRTDRWKGADLGWLVKAENFAKVIEGNYHTEEVAA